MRVVDENDVIPMLPPGIANKAHGPYDHAGPEVILLEGPRYVYLTQHDASRLAVGEFWRSMGVADLPDHKMDNYLKRLSSKTKRAVEVAYNQREKYTAKPPAARQGGRRAMNSEERPMRGSSSPPWSFRCWALPRARTRRPSTPASSRIR